MKAYKSNSFTGKAATLLAAVVITSTQAQYQIPPQATLQLGPGPRGNPGNVQVRDPGNNVWTLQRSPDFKNWKDVERFKIHNGSLRRGISMGPPVEQGFFRAICDPTRQEPPANGDPALTLGTTLLNYAAPDLPAHFQTRQIRAQDNTPANNPVTNAGATLGRVLFHDKRLSANQTVSCASCHQAEHGFSDPRQFSVGFEGGRTGRNSMGLINARYYLRRHFFWDERANTLEDQVLQPIQNPVEMGMTLAGLETRLAAEPFYATLFTQAFGSTEVTSRRISLALAQFVRSIISTNSKYDAGVANGFANFTPQENLGRDIFLGRVGRATCVNCHGSDNFVPGDRIHNNGLENPYRDKGVGEVTGRPEDEGLFKVPSLRNIELTAPYMHDGRFQTLEQVVEFYNSGVVNHPNLSGPLRARPQPSRPPGGALRLNLSNQEKAALVSFLKTLTDRSITTDQRFSDPFNYGN